MANRNSPKTHAHHTWVLRAALPTAIRVREFIAGTAVIISSRNGNARNVERSRGGAELSYNKSGRTVISCIADAKRERHSRSMWDIQSISFVHIAGIS